MTIYEQILAAMQTKFQGADAATLTRIATAKATGITDENQVKTIVDGVSWSDVMTSYADFRATEATKTAVTNYEKKYGIKEGKAIEEPKPTPTPTPNHKDDKPDIAALISDAVAKAVTPLTEKLTTLENEKAESDFNTRVSEAAAKYGIKPELVGMLNVPKDADLDKFMQETKQTFANAGFQEVEPPASSEKDFKKESETLAEQINKGTEEIVSSEKELKN